MCLWLWSETFLCFCFELSLSLSLFSRSLGNSNEIFTKKTQWIEQIHLPSDFGRDFVMQLLLCSKEGNKILHRCNFEMNSALLLEAWNCFYTQIEVNTARNYFIDPSAKALWSRQSNNGSLLEKGEQKFTLEKVGYFSITQRLEFLMNSKKVTIFFTKGSNFSANIQNLLPWKMKSHRPQKNQNKEFVSRNVFINQP